MKFRNLLCATMIACAFASCSKDAESNLNPQVPELKGDANLTIDFNLLDVSTRTADEDANAYEKEADLNVIHVALYDGDKFIAEATNNKSDKATFTGLPTGKDLAIVVVANMTKPNFSGMTPTAIASGELAFQVDNFMSTSLPMYGTGKTGVLEAAPAENKAIVDVVRDVARVQVSAIGVQFSATAYTAGSATFALKNITLDDVASKAQVSGAYWMDNTYLYGFAGYVAGAESTPYYLHTASGEAATAVTHTIGSGSLTPVAGLQTSLKATYYFYAFPNESASNKTVLTIAGDFSLKDAVAKDGSIVNLAPAISYYPVVIGETGVTGGSAKVAKNMIYDINLTIAGAGYDTPKPDPDKKANFTVIVNVKPWSGIVNQNVTID